MISKAETDESVSEIARCDGTSVLGGPGRHRADQLRCSSPH